MHGDASMTLFLWLLAFVANIGVGVYSLFLRSQIAAMREGEKRATDTQLELAQLKGRVGTYQADRDRLQRDLEFERSRLEDARSRQTTLASQIGECQVRLASAASKEAAQGIRGDLSTLGERVVGLGTSVDQLSKRIEGHAVTVEKSVEGLERRIERHETYHAQRGG